MALLRSQPKLVSRVEHSTLARDAAEKGTSDENQILQRVREGSIKVLLSRALSEGEGTL